MATHWHRIYDAYGRMTKHFKPNTESVETWSENNAFYQDVFNALILICGAKETRKGVNCPMPSTGVP